MLAEQYQRQRPAIPGRHGVVLPESSSDRARVADQVPRGAVPVPGRRGVLAVVPAGSLTPAHRPAKQQAGTERPVLGAVAAAYLNKALTGDDAAEAVPVPQQTTVPADA